MDLEIRTEIKGNRVTLYLLDAGREVLGKTGWEDKRDLSAKLFGKIDFLLRRKKISLKDIKKFSFDCDSPYFARGKNAEIKMETFDSTGKCGFTAWQTGEIITKVMNFATEK